MICMIWEILGMFDTFTKLRTYGQHPGRMSRMGVGGRGLIFVSLVFYMFQSILNIFFFAFFGRKKLIIFTLPPPIPGKFRDNN